MSEESLNYRPALDAAMRISSHIVCVNTSCARQKAPRVGG